jgi:hypothetical protein
VSEDRERRMGNITQAHALVQSQLFWLTLAIAGGYHDAPADARSVRRRMSKDCQDVIDAAIQLKRVVMSGGDVEPVVPPQDPA